jgi:hypothetical protein
VHVPYVRARMYCIDSARVVAGQYRQGNTDRAIQTRQYHVGRAGQASRRATAVLYTHSTLSNWQDDASLKTLIPSVCECLPISVRTGVTVIALREAKKPHFRA